MTILHVMHSHSIGGVERHVVTLSRVLTERGHRVILACPSRSWMWDAVSDTPVIPHHIAMDGLTDRTSTQRLARLVDRYEVDLVHAHQARGSYYAGKVAKRRFIPSIATAHAPQNGKHFAGANRILCVCDAVRQSLLRQGIPAERMHVVYNGTVMPRALPSQEAVAELRTSWGVEPDQRIVGMLAPIRAEKGIDVLLEVATRWISARPDVRFVIAGGGDEATLWFLKEIMRERGLDETVKFVGPIPNNHLGLAAFDVLAAPSRYEAFPLTLLEAMSVHTPVVTTNVGGTPEIVTDGSTGWLIPVDDPDALERALVGALDGEGLRCITDQAEQMVRDRFTVRRMVDEIEDHYRALVR